ncbi:aspartate-semialdehyde dehydrogenase [Flavobacteriaceae bacterium]|jgi:aspartate-semialdehyde dehydrogenase|nr:aspartate-semialdehyde dehydrogenase [Flavobacteriaceae bacterium]MDB2350389.1 aspartate-semialdehyde dehydrogenase [Flavobacteriaceae bacterium]MDC0477531.1 aspartate-semialdehyde dehydrogenase [Flavobacteriaceae bacterium]
MKLAIIGATGLVGSVLLKILKERKFPLTKLILVASKSSIGKKINFNRKAYEIVSLDTALKLKPNIVLFSAGSDVSIEWAPKFKLIGSTVIDNSSAWRMDSSKKLIVPEINAHLLSKKDKIIANPNCSTIQLVIALSELHNKFNIKRLVISTYQSVTGTGVKAINQLESETIGKESEKAYPYKIYKNAIPHCDIFEKNGYTKEEMKLVNETKKILSDDSICITATAVRIPVMGGHSEAVNVEFSNPFEVSDVLKILKNTSGVTIQDDVKQSLYPMPLTSQGKDDVFVGRIRRDYSKENALNLWVVSDNLRKGAALNAVQIAEYLINENLL